MINFLNRKAAPALDKPATEKESPEQLISALTARVEKAESLLAKLDAFLFPKQVEYVSQARIILVALKEGEDAKPIRLTGRGWGNEFECCSSRTEASRFNDLMDAATKGRTMNLPGYDIVPVSLMDDELETAQEAERQALAVKRIAEEEKQNRKYILLIGVSEDSVRPVQIKGFPFINDFDFCERTEAHTFPDPYSATGIASMIIDKGFLVRPSLLTPEEAAQSCPPKPEKGRLPKRDVFAGEPATGDKPQYGGLTPPRPNRRLNGQRMVAANEPVAA